MNVTLGPEDRRAVDLLLDRSPTAAAAGAAAGHGKAVYATADPSLAERVAAAERLLSKLDALPQSEPSPDLAARTMRMIDQSVHGYAPAARSPMPHLVGSQRPVA